MKKYRNAKETLFFIICILCLFASINSLWAVKRHLWLIPVFILLFIIGNLLPAYSKQPLPNIRFKICHHGTKCLKLFVITSILTVVNHCVMAFWLIPDEWTVLAFSVLVAYILESLLFWNGMICVYCTSTQLGIRIRVLGLVCGMIPIANLIMLGKIIRTTDLEVNFEWKKHVVNMERKEHKICATQYPLLMVHGVFFRDSAKFNYWGRVPKELENNGATIYYGEHQSASSIEDSASELAERIRTLVNQTGCGKLNIIAHSKGGLDCRLAIHKYGLEPYVASLTTINTPHRGCRFSDYLLNKMPITLKNKIADTYNNALRQIGDTNPDFIAAVEDLSSERCRVLNEELPTPQGIFCQSSGSRLKHAVSGKFPLNFSYNIVKHFDGYNDGLVGEESFEWGEKYMFLTSQGLRGISHGDMIDLNREDIPGFDVREWYVELVADLKNRGY